MKLNFKLYILSLLALLLSLCAPIVTAQTNVVLFQAGKHYQKLPESSHNNEYLKQLKADSPTKIQVLFFFNYACHWCGHSNEQLNTWSKQNIHHEQFILRKIPIGAKGMWHTLAQVYYTAEALNSTATIDKAMFNGIHEKKLPLWLEPNLETLFEQYGFDKAKFQATFHSFSIENKLKFTDALALALKITTTPNVIISGPINTYRTDLVLAHDEQTLFKVIDYLIQKEAH